MTGIGHGRAHDGTNELRVEIRSVNHRFLDVVMRLPDAFASFETEIRQRLQEVVDRGRLSVTLEFEQTTPQLEVTFHEPFVKAFVVEARRIARAHGVRDDLSVSDLAQIDRAFVVREKDLPEEILRPLLDRAFDQALDDYQTMRAAEGAKLRDDLSARVDRIERHVQAVSERAQEVPAELRRRLEERLERMGAKDQVDPQRLAAEVVLLVDKATVHEELERMESHLSQFRETIAGEGPTAKRLGFLLQEMHREVNTTGSKSSDLTITDAVVRMKEEIENIREQIQNLE